MYQYGHELLGSTGITEDYLIIHVFVTPDENCTLCYFCAIKTSWSWLFPQAIIIFLTPSLPLTLYLRRDMIEARITILLKWPIERINAITDIPVSEFPT